MRYGHGMTYDNTSFFTLEQARECAKKTYKRCVELSKRSKRTLVFSHTTLLALRGMTLNLSTTLDESLLHISYPSIYQKSHLKGAQSHVWNHEMQIYSIGDAISGVSVEQAICQLAPFTDVDSLTMVMDWLTCHQPNLRQTTHQKLEEYINGLRYFRSSKKCKIALSRSVENTDSPQETLLRLSLIDAGLPCPQVNFSIPDSTENRCYLVDMAYPDQQIVIEYDGSYHYDKQRWSYDLNKRNRLQHLGWKVFVATKTNMYRNRATLQFTDMIRDGLHQGEQDIRVFGHPNW